MGKNYDLNSPSESGGIHAAKFGILGALAAILCCVGPLMPILLGLGGATALFGLDRFKPWFIGLGLLILGLASWYAVRKQNRCCAVKSAARNVKTVVMIFGVGIGSYLLLQFVIVPALSSVASSKVAAAHDSASSGTQVTGEEVKLHIDGMDCAACAIGVEAAFLQLPGVVSAKVNWKTGAATVRIDPEKTQPSALLTAKVEPQYTILLTKKQNLPP